MKFENKGHFLVMRNEGVEVIPAIKLKHTETPSKKEREATDASVEQFQQVVGGYFETIGQPNIPGFNLVVNDAGRLNGMRVNAPATILFGRLLYGPVLVCQVGPWSDGLTEPQVAMLQDAVQKVMEEAQTKLSLRTSQRSGPNSGRRNSALPQ